MPYTLVPPSQPASSPYKLVPPPGSAADTPDPTPDTSPPAATIGNYRLVSPDGQVISAPPPRMEGGRIAIEPPQPDAEPPPPNQQPSSGARIKEAITGPMQRPLVTGGMPGPLGALLQSAERWGVDVPSALYSGGVTAAGEALKKAGMEPQSADRLVRDLEGVPEAFMGMFGAPKGKPKAEPLRREPGAPIPENVPVSDFERRQQREAQAAQQEQERVAQFQTGSQERAAAAKTEAQQRTAQTAQAARETVTAPEFSIDDLGPQLTGKVNMARYRAGQAPADKFTLEDLQRADVPQADIDRLSLAKRPATQALRTEPEAALAGDVTPAAPAPAPSRPPGPPEPAAAPADPRAPPPAPGAAPAPPAAASGNKLFTDSMVEAARERLRGSAGALRSGVNPQDLADLAIIGAYHIERGARSFADFSTRMVQEMGEQIRPQLQQIYTAAMQRAPNVMPPEGALAHEPALTKPRSFEDQLFQLEGNKVADRIDTLKALKEVPEEVKPDTWEKLYHFEEDPKGVTLTPEERDLYDKHVAPLKAEADNLASKLETFGYPVEEREHLTAQPDSEGYTPRYVAGRTRSFGEVLDQWKQGVEARFGGAAGRSMRKTVDAQKSRRFWNAVNPSTGERTVVHVGTDGTVLGFDGTTEPREVGTFGKGQKIEAGSKVRVGGETWKLEPATTKEIEAVAQTRYQKNVLANRLDNVAKLRSAVRNAQFIEDMKASPDWEKVAVKVSDHANAPVTNGREWRIPKMPQFRQYYMEAPLADALDDALGRQREIEGLSSALDKAGSFIKGSIFWNPLPHMRNVANHYFVEKGLVGTATSIPSTFKSLLNAARSVATQDADYMRILRSGASLPYARNITRDVHNTLISKLGEDVAANPGAWKHIANLAGKANPVELIRSLYSVSNTALWSFGDALSVARIKELEGKGMPLEKAIRETEAHMPNYRIPGQVLGQRVLSQILTQPLATMFGRYQYNRLASYMTMARDLVARDVPLKQRAETLDKLAMLGVLLTVYYPMLDKAWQAITSNPNAKVSRPGAMSVPQAGIDVATGEKTPAQGVQSVFSPGPVEAPIELYHGRYLWSGRPIAYPENVTDGHPGQFIRDLLAWVGSKLQPVGQAQRIIEGGTTPSQFLLQQLGVSSPTEQQAAAKEHFKAKDAQDAARRAGRLELQRSAQ